MQAPARQSGWHYCLWTLLGLRYFCFRGILFGFGHLDKFGDNFPGSDRTRNSEHFLKVDGPSFPHVFLGIRVVQELAMNMEAILFALQRHEGLTPLRFRRVR